jgi:peptide/nickel transport system substrate-binding protein
MQSKCRSEIQGEDNVTKSDSHSDGADLSRRSFIGRACATGLSLSVDGALWSREAYAATPQRGGHLRLGLAGGSTADTLDPSLWGDTFMVMVGYAVRGGLTEFGADGQIRADVAESWESSADARKWIFKLRKDATFSNGKSLGADDVVASLNFHRGEQSKSGAKALFESVTDIRADGKDTVIVSLSSGIVDFAYSMTDHHINILPAVDGVPDWKSGVGAGPYKLEHFEPGVRAVLTRNPSSYKSGYLDSAEMLGIADVVTRQSALLTNRVDVINRADLKTAHMLGQRPGIRVEQQAGRLHYWLCEKMTVAPFSNKDVRTALKYGINREELLKVIFNGYGSVGNDQPITPAYRYYDEGLAPKRYDPDKARFYLKKAGYDKLSLEFHTSDAVFNGAVDLAVLYREQAAKAGIDIKVVREASDGYWANVASTLPSWYATYWSGRATEDTMFTVGFAKNSPWNYSHWDNADFNRLLVQARQETDDSRRRDMYYELQRITNEDSGVIIPIFANSVSASLAKVRHDKVVAGNWELDGGRLIERWWLA